MNQRLTFSTVLMLTLPPVLWAGNAVVGRLVAPLVPPLALNFLRWALAFVLLLPFAWPLLRAESPLWPRFPRFAVLGLLGVGCYNAFQYLALKTSTPINVTLVGSSIPPSCSALGALFFASASRPRQVLARSTRSDRRRAAGAGARRTAHLAQVHFVTGDLYMLLAHPARGRCTAGSRAARRSARAPRGLGRLPDGGRCPACLVRPVRRHRDGVRAGSRLQGGWPLAAALAVCRRRPGDRRLSLWGQGVQRAGPNVAGFFSNLTPLFAALFSAAFLGEPPHLYTRWHSR